MIDASGHVVAPGFIDTHSHNVPTSFGQRMALRDGVTTPLELEFGVLPVALWYDKMAGKSQTNYGATAGLQGAREMVLNPKYKTVNGATINDVELGKQTSFDMAWSKTVATDEQVEQILALIDEGLRQGTGNRVHARVHGLRRQIRGRHWGPEARGEVRALRRRARGGAGRGSDLHSQRC